MKSQKLKIATVVGTRPEIIRLSRVIDTLDRYCEHTLVHTGQNYDFELSKIFFNEMQLREPDIHLNCAEEGHGAAHTIGNIISRVDQVLENIKPDAMLVLGDTNSCLSAISGKRRKIPVFHMEAGNRSFDQRVPEEINRRIVDHTSDINLTYSTIARDNLLREGMHPDQVIKTGSPMYEVMHYYMPQILAAEPLKQLGLEEGKYFLVSAHREENVDNDKSFVKLINVINSLAANYNLPVIFSTHPRTRKRIENSHVNFKENVFLSKPLGFYDYNHLQLKAKAVLSDSGSITEESSILNFPALNLRETHERLEGMEEASVMMVGLDQKRIMQALQILEDQPRDLSRGLRLVADYNIPNVSEKVVRLIHSYTDYVRRVVWKEY